MTLQFIFLDSEFQKEWGNYINTYYDISLKGGFPPGKGWDDYLEIVKQNLNIEFVVDCSQNFNRFAEIKFKSEEDMNKFSILCL